jgi:hypothetical protein
MGFGFSTPKVSIDNVAKNIPLVTWAVFKNSIGIGLSSL